MWRMKERDDLKVLELGKHNDKSSHFIRHETCARSRFWGWGNNKTNF